MSSHIGPTTDRATRPLERFVRWESSSATLLIGTAVAALIWANLSGSYAEFWGAHASVETGPIHLDESLRHWVNDLLMAVFFFVVALEVKREMLFGSLRDRRSALVPGAAALGTMIGAGAVYVAVNLAGDGDLAGWAIPIATDIAFALGVLGLAGSRAPRELRAFMLTLAVVDDLCTILVIAIFFTNDLSFGWLAAAVAVATVIALARRAGIGNLAVYVVLAAGLWLTVFESGVHATVAGVVLGFMTPARAAHSCNDTAASITGDLGAIPDDDRDVNDVALLHTAQEAVRGVSPLARLEDALHPYSSYLILPLFALANAGVPISIAKIGNALTAPIGLGIFLGLVVGAPAGGMVLAFASVRLGPARMPENLDWPAIGGVAPLKGIGFTIAIFITTLAFDDQARQDTATLAVLAASLVSAIIGLGAIFIRHMFINGSIQHSQPQR